MGCGASDTTDGKAPAKQFHDLNEEEQKIALKQMEEQDKNLKEEENKKEDPNAYERYNWDELIKKLPTSKTTKERKLRLDLWKKVNEYGNGFVSYKRLSIQLEKYLDLPNVVKNKGPMK